MTSTDSHLPRRENSARTLASRRARSLVLSALLLPAAAAGVIGILQHFGYLSEGAALPVFALATVVIFTAIAWYNGSVLVTSEERYELAVRGTNDGIWDWDVRANRLFWSDRFKEILGITDPDFKPSYDQFKNRLHPDERDFIVARLEDHTRNCTPYDTEFRMRHENGGYIWVRARGLSIWDERGIATRMTGSVSDIMMQKLAEQDLRAAKEQADMASRAKSDFLSRMSHELRTPLNSILGLTRMLYEDAGIGAEHRDMAGVAYRSADNLLVIVNHMLDLTKIEAGQLQLDHVPFVLADVVTSVTESMAPLAGDKGLQFSCQFSGKGLPLLVGDPTRLGRVMINLIGNAIKYTEHGSVTVTVDWDTDDDGQVMMRCDVIDTGIGIPDDLQEAIFASFTQADTSITRRFEGAGLGLSVSRLIIEKMDGRMGVSSSEGVGSRFWFIVSFPAEGSAAAKKRVPHRRLAERLPAGQRTAAATSRILVAEDYTLNQAFIKKLLSRMGIDQVDIVDNGKLAFDAIQRHSYALVLMDCHMPVMSGFDAVERIREREKAENLPRLPVIAITADALPGTRERCLAAGMDDYIAKPVDAGLLKDIMSRWLAFADEASTAPPAKPRFAASQAIEVLKQYSDSEEELQALIEAFMTGANEVMTTLTDNCGDGESRAWSEAAHKLKGSAAMLQAEELRALAEKAENMKVATADERDAILKKIKSELEDLTAAIAPHHAVGNSPTTH